MPASKAETRPTGSVSAPGPGSNPYHVRLSELEKYRPMTATGRSPLDPADEDDLLPTSTFVGAVIAELIHLVGMH